MIGAIFNRDKKKQNKQTKTVNLIPNMYYRIKHTNNRLELKRNVGSPMG